MVAGALALAAPVAAITTDASEQPPGLVATSPERYWDSRTIFGGDKNPPGGKIAVSAAEIAAEALGIDPVDPIPDDAEALFVNVTAVEAEAPGFVSVVTGANERLDLEFVPDTSNLNVDTPGQTIANSAIIPLGDIDYGEEFGEVPSVIVHSSMTTHVLVDVLGYVPAGAGYSPIAPKRTLDTRLTTRPVAGSTTTAVVGADAPEGATLAIVNLTMDQSEEWGYLTAWPTGSDFPPTSNVNVFGPGQTRAGLSILPIGDDDSINLFTFRGADLIVDVFGYFDETAFDALDPFPRIYDSRALGARVPAGGQVDVQVAGVQGIPAGATAVFATITATDASDPGFVTVWPSGLDQPEASNLNYATGGTIANTVLVPLGADGKISIFTQSEIDLIVDVIGSF